MVTIKLRDKSDGNGDLTIHVPAELHNRELEVLVVLQPMDASTSNPAVTTDQNGWPAGFFDDTYGCLADDPVTRLPQGSAEEREALL
jgi:hypothetical protein